MEQSFCPIAYGGGPFSCLSFHRRRWTSISCRKICIYCKCMPPLTHTVSHLKAYFGQTFSLTRAMQLVDHWAIAMSQREGRITLGGLGLLETSLGKNLQILIWISPEPLCSHIPQGNGLFYCLHDRQNLSDFDLLLGKPLIMTSDSFLLCTENAGSTLLLLWWCESGRDVLLCPFLETLKDMVPGEQPSYFGLSKMTDNDLAATCLQPSWLASQLRAEVTR